MNQSSKHERDELAWLAFQYVAGELPAAAADQFEERLALDQTAREAVAQSVELYHAVAAVEAATTVGVVTIAAKEKSTWSQRLVWLSTGAAAAALLAVATWNANGLLSSFNSKVSSKPGVSPDLVKAWTAVRADLARADEEATSDETSRPMASDLTDAELAAIVEEELALPMDTPSWMTAAVQSLSVRPVPLDAGESVPQEN
jgi:hypothetical protein